MKARRTLLLVLMTMGLSLLVAARCAPASITAYGEVTDAIGDSLNASVDLTLGSISITCEGDAVFRVRYAPGYDSTTGWTCFAMDLDQNPLTGSSWFGMGNEASIYIRGTDFQGDCWVRLYPGPSSFVSVNYLSDGVEVTVPLGALNSDDGLMNFHVCSCIQLEDDVTTSIRDWMPERGADFNVGVGVVVPVTSCIPAPSVVLLGAFGAGFVGWLRRHKTL